MLPLSRRVLFFFFSEVTVIAVFALVEALTEVVAAALLSTLLATTTK